MVSGVGHNSAASVEQSVSPNTPLAGPGAAGGYLANQKDATESSTAPKFGEIYNQIQAKYGAKAEKPREIKKTLGKDDFLRIMITQMRHQDPTSPFKPEQMAAEMAQFTSLEQLQNVNTNLTKMASQNQPLERLAMTNMIGKVVTIDRDRFPHAEGSNESLTVSLPKDATAVKVALVSEAGETVFEKDLGQQKAGEVNFSWDGRKSNTLPAKGGNYMLRVDAKDEKGVPIQTNSQGMARVVGVSFEGSEPVFLVGDNRHQDKVTLRNIVRIESDGAMQTAASAPAAAPTGIVPVNTQKAPNFIAFQKGVGSSNVASNGIPPEAADALRKFEESQAAGTASAPRVAVVDNEKGFPNGLRDTDVTEATNEQTTKVKGGESK